MQISSLGVTDLAKEDWSGVMFGRSPRALIEADLAARDIDPYAKPGPIPLSARRGKRDDEESDGEGDLAFREAQSTWRPGTGRTGALTTTRSGVQGSELVARDDTTASAGAGTGAGAGAGADTASVAITIKDTGRVTQRSKAGAASAVALTQRTRATAVTAAAPGGTQSDEAKASAGSGGSASAPASAAPGKGIIVPNVIKDDEYAIHYNEAGVRIKRPARMPDEALPKAVLVLSVMLDRRELRPNPNRETSAGHTPLTRAAECGRGFAIAALLDRGADIDLQVRTVLVLYLPLVVISNNGGLGVACFCVCRHGMAPRL